MGTCELSPSDRDFHCCWLVTVTFPVYLAPIAAPRMILIILRTTKMSHMTAKTILRIHMSLTPELMLFLYKMMTTMSTGPKKRPTMKLFGIDNCIGHVDTQPYEIWKWWDEKKEFGESASQSTTTRTGR